MTRLALTLAALCATASPALAEFSIAFDWGNIPRCTTGNPNTVGSPAFVIRDLPAGTTSVEFKLTDLDVPQYKHGGAKLKIGQSGQLPFGAFKYKSPCPPSGSHTYEWTATARNGNTVLARAAARRSYP